jgi:hypothetical protein
VSTTAYDWGNVCARDEFGVHHCRLPAGHEGDDVCTCGTRRLAGKPPNRV